MTGSSTMARPTLWLLPLLVVILTGALGAPWSSVATVDERTYLEMALGIQQSGLPTVANGPVERFPELQARWNLYRDDRLWGVMAPALPYLTAPLLELGGLGLVLRLNLALLALLAMAVYLLGKLATGEPQLGVGAAYVALLSMPLWTSSFGLLPYSLILTAMAWALALGLRAQLREDVRWALAAGLLAGLAITSQLLAFPMAVGLVAALAWHSPRLGLAAGLGTTPGLALLAALNRTRFGSWNPLSDGPCVWQGCPESGIDPQSTGHMLAAALPVALWLTVGAVGLWWLGRYRWPGRIAAALIVVLPLLAVPSLRQDLGRYLLLGWRLLVDVGVWGEAENTATAADGLGTFIGPHVVKSLLQSSPALVLVAAARPWRRLTVLWLPVLALFGMLLLRAPMPVDFALGHPFLNMRYLAPAAPALAVLAVLGARRLPWRLSHLALAGLVAAALRWTLRAGADDLELWRRLLLLRGSLLVAMALAIAVALALYRPQPRRTGLATVLAALAFGWGAGVSLGVDLEATVRLRDRVDTLVRDLDTRLPQRLALIGHPNELDAPLTLKAGRDLQYLDLKEVEDAAAVLGPAEWWWQEERPVFWLLPPGESEDELATGVQLLWLEPDLGLAAAVPIDPATAPPATIDAADPTADEDSPSGRSDGG